jgi:hypothetical protein
MKPKSIPSTVDARALIISTVNSLMVINRLLMDKVS